MNRQAAIRLITDTFGQPFDESRFKRLVREVLNHVDPSRSFSRHGQYVPGYYQEHIRQYKRPFIYTDPDGNRLDVLIVRLKKRSGLERALTMQRNFIAWYLNQDHDEPVDAALVAFYHDDVDDWRFSFVQLEFVFGEEGIETKLTPARRYSYLVGPHEPSHTAVKQLLPLLEKEDGDPRVEELADAFRVEPVTDQFFDDYTALFHNLLAALEKTVKRDRRVDADFKRAGIDLPSFAKKLLGQIVFLYFLQKKGWLGVKPGAPWGTGPRDFLRRLFEKVDGVRYDNFFNDVLEYLFYDALAVQREGDLFDQWGCRCKIPFLNGGLFEPMGGYDWRHTSLDLPNALFSNRKSPDDDSGTGILDVFDRYNFTIREEAPLEKEVAVDPEMLGKVFENLLEVKDRKSKGAFYTPREIVHYMCQESLTLYLDTFVKGKGIRIPQADLEVLVKMGHLALQQDAATAAGMKTGKYVLPESVRNHARELDAALADIKVCDPAIGSGAFPVGMLHEVVQGRQVLDVHLGTRRKPYALKRHAIQESLYGVDIDGGAIEIAKLRLWLSLVVDEESYSDIQPLPNLDYKIVQGNSLLGYPYQRQGLEKLERLRKEFFGETDQYRKMALRKQIDNELAQIFKGTQKSLGYQVDFDFRINFSEVFRSKQGFDIVIGNPPYVSTKGRQQTAKKALKSIYGFADDLYNHFYFRGIEILREQGTLSYISSKTFWTIQTKRNLRRHLQSFRLIELSDTGAPFKAMVDTSIVILKKHAEQSNYPLVVKDAKHDFLEPREYQAEIKLYRQAVNQVFFLPSPFNMAVYKKYNDAVRRLMDTWWMKIATSREIAKNHRELARYRESLQPGDVTLIGLITEGGQGLATGNNGKYVGVLEGTKYATRVRQSRPKKLWEAIQTHNIHELAHLRSKEDVKRFLDSLDELAIRHLFDDLKVKYGRDIFGQGYLFRIVSFDELADVDRLTQDEKLNGIKGQRTYVPYDKGDREGNRWYLRTPYYIDWSRENVHFLRTNSGKKGIGMPVVRNLRFYFREGLCWSDVHTIYIKARLKAKGVHDVKSMSIFSLMEHVVPEYYLIAILNSTFISFYVHNFINNTQTFQINDARQVPIIVPTPQQRRVFKSIFDEAYHIKEQQFDGILSKEQAEAALDKVQKRLDREVYRLYGFSEDEIALIPSSQ